MSDKLIPYGRYKKDPAILSVEDICKLFDLTPYSDFEGEYAGKTPYDFLEENNLDDRVISEFAYKHSNMDEHWNGGIMQLHVDCVACEDGEIEEGRDCPHCKGHYRGCDACDEGRLYSYKTCDQCQGAGHIVFNSTFEFLEAHPEYEQELDAIRDSIVDDHYKRWINALTETLEKFLLNVDLDMDQVMVGFEKPAWHGEGERRKFFKPTQPGYVIKPRCLLKKDKWVREWKPACKGILEVIEGVGYFGWDGDVQRFITEESCKSYKDAAMSHLSWIKYWGDVYGDRNMETVFQSNWEDQMRNW